MSKIAKQKAISYADAVHAMNSSEVVTGLDEACTRLCDAILGLHERFSCVARYLHSVDLLALAPPLKPQWETLHKVRPPPLCAWCTKC
jgi:hypothetical protein